MEKICILHSERITNPYIKGKYKTFAAFMHLSGAFDKVNHYLLDNVVLERNILPDTVLCVLIQQRRIKEIYEVERKGVITTLTLS